MSFRLRHGASAAKFGVRAARESASRMVGVSTARAKDVVEATGERADETLDAIEAALIAVVEMVARQGHARAREARRRINAAISQALPERRASPIAAIILAVGASLLLSRLLTPRSVSNQCDSA